MSPIKRSWIDLCMIFCGGSTLVVLIFTAKTIIVDMPRWHREADAWQAKCQKLGGVFVAQSNPWVCVKPDAIIKIEE